MRRNAKVRVSRGGEPLHTGEMQSLKREKEDVREVRQGFECGIALKGFNDLTVGDVIECFVIE